MRNVASLLLTAVLAASLSCGGTSLTADASGGHDTAPPPDAADAAADGDGAVACDPSLTYASFGMAFFATYCNTCHSWDQQSAQTSGEVIVGAAGTGTFMPPGDPRPSPQERAQLTSWITCGAP